MIRITVNGVPTRLDCPMSVANYLEDRGYNTARIAVELNGAILPKARYSSTALTEADTWKL